MMKATTQQAAGFKPIELTITIESRRELEFLWELMNSSGNKMSGLLSQGSKFKDFSSVECSVLSRPIYNELDRHI